MPIFIRDDLIENNAIIASAYVKVGSSNSRRKNDNNFGLTFCYLLASLRSIPPALPKRINRAHLKSSEQIDV